MRSFDLFGTLVAGRNPEIRDGDQDSHFPIMENVAKVRPGDLVISDFYNADKAHRILKEVAGLDNDLIVTHDGKASGKVWQRLQACGQTPELHIGDDPLTDLASPRANGVKSELVILAGQTALESEMQSRGFSGLARLMRETRLATWHEERTFRQLQLFQAQINLPFLFLASILVHRKMEGHKRLLMSARDCWLWFNLYAELWMHHLRCDYDVTYFLTSRLTRYFPSENYRRYVQELCSVPTLIVDLCGFGRSLQYLFEGESSRPDLLLLVGYEDCCAPSLISGWLNETTNFARHPMIADVGELGAPIYANPLGVDWAKIPELAVMHETFLCGTASVSKHDFSRDLDAGTEQVELALRSIFGHFDDYVQALGTLTAFRVEEARATADLINARGCVEGVVV